MTASVTSAPRYASASLFSFIRMRAEISWGVYFLPSTSMDQPDSPMWRLTERMVLSGLVIAWRLATSPTKISPSLKATTDGVVRAPSAFGITVGSPPSRVAMTLLVVPRSIPTARAMVQVLSKWGNSDHKLQPESPLVIFHHFWDADLTAAGI